MQRHGHRGALQLSSGLHPSTRRQNMQRSVCVRKCVLFVSVFTTKTSLLPPWASECQGAIWDFLFLDFQARIKLETHYSMNSSPRNGQVSPGRTCDPTPTPTLSCGMGGWRACCCCFGREAFLPKILLWRQWPGVSKWGCREAILAQGDGGFSPNKHSRELSDRTGVQWTCTMKSSRAVARFACWNVTVKRMGWVIYIGTLTLKACHLKFTPGDLTIFSYSWVVAIAMRHGHVTVSSRRKRM